jgi:integrase
VPKPRTAEKNPRGLFERPSGSGVWWINYYEHGKQRREKVGRKSDTIKLYQQRRADIQRGHKLPPLRRTSPVMINDLVDLMLEHVRNQKHKDQRTYETRGEIVRRELGSRDAEAFTPQDLETWLSHHCRTSATFNRYKALVSLAYRQGIWNKKVTVNPARLIPQRKEPKGRLRFLSREEFDKLRNVIETRFPEHLAEYVVAVHSGMRLSEQYTVEVRQFDRHRRAIDLDRTKNGDARTVHLNSEALAAIESVLHLHPRQKRSERMFPREDRSKVYTDRKQERFDNRSWFEVAVEEAQIPRITWHGLRHTFCSWLAMAGATTREIMEAAGHKTMSQAARYAHLSPQHTQSVVDRIVEMRLGHQHAPKHAPGTREG